MLIALYERVVGLYGSLVDVNAYNQPGVEAGKHAASAVIALKLKLTAALKAAPGESRSAEAWAAPLGADPELAYKLLDHLAANGSVRKTVRSPWHESTYGF
jgi:glucose-6-phosphate isomerase